MIEKYCSKILSRLQKRFGRDKPLALDVDGWNDFYSNYKKDMPIRFFLLEKVPEKIDDVFRFVWTNPRKSVRNFIIHRFLERNHVVKTGLPVGYHEVDDRMFHANFHLLKEFVEGELAWMEFICMEENHPLFNKYKKERFLSNHMNFFGIYSSRFYSEDLGILHLTSYLDLNPYDRDSNMESEMVIKQQEKYRNILELYLWYTKERNNRQDDLAELAYDAIKDREKFEKEYGTMFILSDRFKKDHPDVYKEYMSKINNKHNNDEAFYEEDTKMLKKLMDIRSSLWT